MIGVFKRALVALAMFGVLGGPVAASAQVDPAARGLAVQAKASIANLAPATVQPGLQTPPVGFGWDFTTYPIRIYRDSKGKYSTDLDPKSLVPNVFSSSSPATYFADAAASGNSANGTSITTPKQSISQAIQACEATSATSCIIMVKAGLYDRTRDFAQSNTANYNPTKPFALICWGGRCVNGPIVLGLSWSANGTYPTVYQTARSNIIRGLNLASIDTYGDYTDVPLCASVAAVSAATECRYNDGTNEYVKLASGLAPTDATYRMLISGSAIRWNTAVNGYIQGFDVQGGLTAALQLNDAGPLTKNVVVVDSSFRYSGTYSTASTTPTNAITIDNINGIVALFRVTVSKAIADGINEHASTGAPYLLTADSICYDVGRVGNATSQSNNCWTIHEISKGLDLNGLFGYASGGTVRNINTTQAWMLGTISQYDRGDLAYGGSQTSAGFVANDTAKIWAQEVTTRGNINALTASIGATIYTRNVTTVGPNSGAGTITGF